MIAYDDTVPNLAEILGEPDPNKVVEIAERIYRALYTEPDDT